MRFQDHTGLIHCEVSFMSNEYIKFILKSIALLLFCMCAGTIYAAAAPAAQSQVYADTVVIKAEDSASIPILIKNNPGIMGYLITAEYEPDKLVIESVSAGKLSENGIFDYNISSDGGDKVDILWSYTKEIGNDGVLFYLNVRAGKNLGKDKTVITLKCSAEDTFNEKYDTVNPECLPIEITGGKHTVINSTGQSELTHKEPSETVRPETDGATHTEKPESVQGERFEPEQPESEQSESAQSEQSESTQPESTQSKRSEKIQSEQSEGSPPGQYEKVPPDSGNKSVMNNDTDGSYGLEMSGEKTASGNENELANDGIENYSYEDDAETVGDRTIIIDDVVKSKEDAKTTNIYLIIGVAAGGVLVLLIVILGYARHMSKDEQKHF